jgi:hypothetical protein
MNDGSHALGADELVDAAPRRNCGVQWSLPVDARLEQLVRRANAAGERTNRRELLSALVCWFDPDTTDFREMLRRYRTSTVAEVSLSEPDSENVVHIRKYGPGPRRSASA